MFDNSKLLFRVLSGQGDGNKVFPDCSRKIQFLYKCPWKIQIIRFSEMLNAYTIFCAIDWEKSI